MFELPDRREVVDKLCLNALEKEPWLTRCGVKAVKIGDKSEIHVQAPITGFPPKSIARADIPSSTQGTMLFLSSGTLRSDDATAVNTSLQK